MEYHCISADCHIDLWWLPHDLFVANASQAMKERMPYVEQRANGPMWTTRRGDLGVANGKGSTGAMGGGTGLTGRQFVSGKQHRIDRMASTGLYTDGSRGIFRPTTPELRIKDQERDGVQAEVIYGLLHTGTKLKADPEAAVECYRIYNEWLASFCSYDRRRFVGLASIPSYTVEMAVTETRRAGKLGLGGLDVSITHDIVPLWDPCWDPLWKAAADENLAVHFHTIGGPPAPAVREGLSEDFKEARRASHTATSQLYAANVLAQLIHGGALERYPNLRIVIAESGIGWLPYVLDRMDYEYEDRFRNLISHLKMKPSDYWHRQCRATFQYDRIGARLLDEIGVENVMWGSDYPHSDGVFPDSQEYIQRQFGGLPADVRRKIICENVGKFYGLIPS